MTSNREIQSHPGNDERMTRCMHDRLLIDPCIFCDRVIEAREIIEHVAKVAQINLGGTAGDDQ